MTEPGLIAATPQLGRYTIDPEHSAITFRTRHLFGLAPVHGSFALRSGTADIAEPLAESRIYAEIETASFRTPSRQRDRSVMSSRFLDPSRYPVMVFRSGRIDAGTGILAGALTVGDVTRPLGLTVTHCAASRQSFTARATARIDRTDFGITAARGLAGRYLTMTVEVQCARI